MKPVTIRDMAQQANVSTAAVSKVLHGSGQSIRVSPERAAHIRSVAERLNYRANALARQLRTSRTHTIGVFFENLKGLMDGPLYTTNLLDGVASELFKNHYRLTVLAEIDHHNVIGSLADGQLEGVLWCKLARDEEMVDQIRQMPIPVVAINAAAPDPDTDTVYVNCDNQGGMELAVEHLWGLGHSKIAFVHETEERGTPDCVARREGYEQAMHRRGGRPTVLEAPWSMTGLPEQLLESGCTAVCCWTESSAGRLLTRLQEAGVTVPERLSVVGFDSTMYCETTNPRLTAVRQPIREMAAYATQALLDLISGQKKGHHSIVFPCSFDERGSTRRKQ